VRRYLGLDVGGTKTYGLVASEDGEILGFGRAGCGNYEACGVESARREVEKAAQSALADAALRLDAIDAIGLGVAGADLPEDYEMLEREMLAPLFGDLPRAFHNDSMGGLRGGTRTPWGIVVACGTDTVCAGRNPAGQTARVGGFGEEFGNLASGTTIGRDGLRSVFRAREGIIPATLLTGKFAARAQVADVDALFHDMYHGRVTPDDLQPMAPLVFEAAFEGDAVACDILSAAGRYLAAMANALVRKLGMADAAFEVVMAGSVFKGTSPVLIDAMREGIHRLSPGARLVMPEFEPVVGALLLGMELQVQPDDAVYQRLTLGLDAVRKRHGVALRLENR
jgi:N-acetylglucosamine kinase-like BadF-type ATPase